MEKIDSRDNLIRLIEKYKNLVFSVCLKMTGDYFTAEDITQETFIAAFRYDKPIPEEAEKAWLCRIATNKCIDWKRESARKSIPVAEEEMPEESLNDSENPLHMVLCKETVDTLKQECEQLPAPYSIVARMYFSEGLTAAQIAERTGVGLKTVQTQIYRARELLKKKIRKEDLLT